MSTPELLHGTTDRLTGIGDEAWCLLPANRHDGKRVWTPETGYDAPSNLLYLGDPVAICFSVIAANALGGIPVVLAVDAEHIPLRADPAYVEATSRLGADWEESYLACGRVATQSSASITRRYRASVPLWTLTRTLEHYGMWAQMSSWPDNSIWKNAAKDLRMKATSGSEFRVKFGQRFLVEAFTEF